MRRKLTKRNKEFMSKLLKGNPVGRKRGKFIFKRCRVSLFRANKPYSPLQFSYTIWKFRRYK